MRKQSLRQSVKLESILDVAEFQGRNLCIDYKENESIIGDMIFYHWSINYVASKFHPIKILIFHWQSINEIHQCSRPWRFRLTSNTQGSWSDDYINLEVMKPCFCMSSCLKENVPAACNDAVSADKVLPLFLSDDESLTVPSTGPIQVRLSYITYHDDRWAVATRISWSEIEKKKIT